MTRQIESDFISQVVYARALEEYCVELEFNQVLSASARQFKEMEERLEAAEKERDIHRAERKLLSDAFAEQLKRLGVAELEFKQCSQLLDDAHRSLEAAERDAARWHEYLAKKKVLADRGFGESPMRNEAVKESK